MNYRRRDFVASLAAVPFGVLKWQQPSTILVNGNIVTMDAAHPRGIL